MEKTVLSIIIPVYNVEKYIDKCLGSLAIQSLRKCEIIIIDDGSTDNSSKIADEYVSRFPKNFKKFKKSNGGLSSARNYGIKMATGQYIAFVDSDDYVSLDFISNILKMIAFNPDIIRFNLTKINNNIEIHHQELRFNSFKELQTYILIDEVGNQACSNVYKKEIISDIPFRENVVFEDLYWTYKVFNKAKSIRYIDSPMYYYLMRIDSITHSTKKRKISNDTFYAFLERLDYAKKSNNCTAIEILIKKTSYHALSNLKHSSKHTKTYKESKTFIKLHKKYIKWNFKNIMVYYFNYLVKFFYKI